MGNTLTPWGQFWAREPRISQQIIQPIDIPSVLRHGSTNPVAFGYPVNPVQPVLTISVIGCVGGLWLGCKIYWDKAITVLYKWGNKATQDHHRDTTVDTLVLPTYHLRH